MPSQFPDIVIAIPNFAPTELPIIEAKGIDLILIDESELREHRLQADIVFSKSAPSEAMLRSARLPHETYQYLYTFLQKKNVFLINSPEMVKRTSEFELHYPLIEEATPRSIVTSANISATDLFEEIQRKGLEFPLFVKTEIKSLKSGSVITAPTIEAIDTVLHNLRTQLSGFYRVIVREMVKLRKLPNHPDTVLEYRAFVLHNQIITVQDGTEGKPCPPLSETGGDSFYREWVSKLAKTNFSNFYIMDIALLADQDRFVIIEIKDGQYTKIRNVESFWNASA